MTFFSRKSLVATHSGHFHPDDVCAVAILHILLGGRYRLVRTRDPKIYENADYVVDVGDVYDPPRQRFDHHQKGGAGARASGAPYAAFGLVWKEYGEKLCGSKEGAEEIDRKIVAHADALDNGVDNSKGAGDSEPPYLFADFLFSHNPSWNERISFDSRFKKAVSYAVIMLSREIERERVSVKGKVLSEKAYQASTDKRIIELSGNYPWRSVFTKHPEPLFVVKMNDDGTWNVKAVPVSKTGFEMRISFPESWAGLKGEALAIASGVPDAIFCHNGRFVAVAKSREGALSLAKKAVDA